MSWQGIRNQVKQLARTAEEWELVQAQGPIFLDEEGEPQGAHVVLLVESGGMVVASQTLERVGDAGLLSAFVTMACLSPLYGEPRRAGSITVEDPELIGSLAQELQAVGLVIKHGSTPAAQFVLEQLLHHLETGPSAAAEGALDKTPDHAVREYFKTAEEFFRARPWEAIDAGKYIAMRLEGRPWRYISIMGAEGEEFGFTVYDSWVDACRLAYLHMGSGDPDAPDEGMNPLDAVEALESISLLDLDMAAPGDVEVINRLRIRSTWRGQHALVQRYGPFGMETPVNSLEEYTAMMQVLTQRVNRTRGGRVTSISTQVETDFGQLDILYPAKGTEDAPTDEYYEVSFETPLNRRQGKFMSFEPAEPVGVRVLAPAGTKWPKVIKTVRKAAHDAGYADPYLDQLTDAILETVLWFGHGSAVEPSPTVAQLAEDVALVTVGSASHGGRAVFRRAAPPREEGISVTLIGQADERPKN